MPVLMNVPGEELSENGTNKDGLNSAHFQKALRRNIH